MNYSETPSIRVLVISPYPGFREILTEYFRGKKEVSVDYMDTGSYPALGQVREVLLHHSYDLLIARGGTADLLRRNLSIPVFGVEITSADILHAVKLAMETNKKCVIIIGVSATTIYARLVTQLLGLDMPILTYGSIEEIHSCLTQAASEGFSIVVGDSTVSRMVPEADITPVLITSAREEIIKTAEEALDIGRRLAALKRNNLLLMDVVDRSSSHGTLVFLENERVLYERVPNHVDAKMLRDLIFRQAKKHKDQLPLDLHRQLDGRMFHIHLRSSFSFDNVRIADFSIVRSVSFGAHTYIHTYAGPAELEQENLYMPMVAQAWIERRKIPVKNLDGVVPVLLIGEEGTFADSAAAWIYEHGKEVSSTFTVIDFSDMSHQELTWLLTHPSSPLFSSSGTLYLRQLSRLSPKDVPMLLQFLWQSAVCMQCKVIFSCLSDLERTFIPQGIIQAVSPKVLQLPPLRDCSDFLPDIALLCINQANSLFNRQTVNLEPDAQQILQAYSWPGNYVQFHHVLFSLVQNEDEVYISAARVEQALEGERAIVGAAHSSTSRSVSSLDLHQPLYRIEREIVRQVIRETGSQKMAAEILGISKTTIWRMLKNESREHRADIL